MKIFDAKGIQKFNVSGLNVTVTSTGGFPDFPFLFASGINGLFYLIYLDLINSEPVFKIQSPANPLKRYGSAAQIQAPNGVWYFLFVQLINGEPVLSADIVLNSPFRFFGNQAQIQDAFSNWYTIAVDIINGENVLKLL